MTRWILGAMVGAGMLSLTLPATSLAYPPAKGKSNGASSAQQDQAKQAVTVLQEDLKQLAQGERQMAEAMSTMKKALKGVTEAEKKATVTLERSMGLDQLLASQRAARAALKEASVPVIEELHQSPDYLKTKATADAARQRLTQIKSNTSLAPEEKRRLEKESAEASMGLTRIEQEAVENSPKTKELKAKSAKVDKEISALRAKIKAAVDNDNGVATAEVELEKAQAEFKQNQKTVAALRQKAGYDQAVALREQQEAQMAQMLDRMKSSKGKSKGKK